MTTCIHYPQFAKDADALFEKAKTSLPWEAKKIRLYGKLIPQPRLTALVGESYTYSGLTHPKTPIPEWMLPLVERVNQLLESLEGSRLGSFTGVRSLTRNNSVLCTLYRDGKDSIAWHADDEVQLGFDPLVASLSLGAERKFQTREKKRLERTEPGPTQTTILRHGDLFVMPRGFQQTHEHAMPKTTRPTGERISFTFRNVDLSTQSPAPFSPLYPRK